MNSNGQAFIFGAVAILLLFMSVAVYALLSPVLKEFIDMGVNSSEQHHDDTTKFFITLIPVWVLFIIVGSGLYLVFSGGGG